MLMIAAAMRATASGTKDATDLLRAYREAGDRRALERVMEMHRGLVLRLAGKYAPASNEPREDLVQAAYVGLLKAVKNYDEVAGAAFATYAYIVVDGEIRHHLRDAALVKKPRWSRGLYAKVTAATTHLEAELGRRPGLEEISDEVNVSPDGIVELMKLYHDASVVSLDGAEEEGVDISAIRSVRQESFLLPIEDRIVLEQAIESLTEIQRKVVYLFFYKDLTQTEVGRHLGLSQRKVSRVVAASLKALRIP